MDKVYIVEALRWGDRENHSYIVGVFTNKTTAEKTAKYEQQWRANKYECVVKEMSLNPTHPLEDEIYADRRMNEYG